jgi:hypothetical protein
MLASDLPALDIAAFSLFAVCWLSYALLANHVVTRRPSLLSTMRIFRTRWIERMSERDLHVSAPRRYEGDDPHHRLHLRLLQIHLVGVAL